MRNAVCRRAELDDFENTLPLFFKHLKQTRSLNGLFIPDRGFVSIQKTHVVWHRQRPPICKCWIYTMFLAPTNGNHEDCMNCIKGTPNPLVPHSPPIAMDCWSSTCTRIPGTKGTSWLRGSENRPPPRRKTETSHWRTETTHWVHCQPKHPKA